MSGDNPGRRPLWDQLEKSGLMAQGKDGLDYLIRAARPSDIPLIERSYSELSERSKWLRFLHAQPELPADLLATFCNPDPTTKVAIVVEGQGPLQGEIVGAAQVTGIGPGCSAEFATTFRSEVRGLGLGRQALETVIEAAREAGCASVWGTISAQNQPMLQLARRVGLERRRDPDDVSWIRAEKLFEDSS